ncbi:hypothetical protein [Pontibacter akesuensis]|uniref:DUF8091 domain-containing protein n=1 Tax=Pontibacter akesuensis TaxID=388950 RepID=A0A1I7KTQ0_9BACT|nr:hypothetical protein [Pontibacter akesuensis]GHA80647.1 hypothetical protein GCM10007389_38750 [Pontibacter akesuensis]SFV00833.1 hypothetical protein SAMN04487941_4104 [Pontibacter akesuensis]
MQKTGENRAAGKGIGIQNERSLHAALKQWYAQPGDQLEVPLGGFFIDLVRGEQLVEIQTRNFSAIRHKLQTLVKTHKVHLLHPVTHEKWVLQVDRTGNKQLSRRKSPYRGKLSDIFEELVRIPELLKHENFSVDFLMIREEEVRCRDGKGSKHRKRESIKDRRLLEVVSTHRFTKAADFLQFIPETLPRPFSNKCLEKALALPLHRCRQITYCLRKMEALAVVGKKGNGLLFDVVVTT